MKEIRILFFFVCSLRQCQCVVMYFCVVFMLVFVFIYNALTAREFQVFVIITYRFLVLLWFDQNRLQPLPLFLRFVMFAARQCTGRATGLRILNHTRCIVAIALAICIAAGAAIMIAIMIMVIIVFRRITETTGPLSHRCQMTIRMFVVMLAHVIRIQYNYSQTAFLLFDCVITAWKQARDDTFSEYFSVTAKRILQIVIFILA